MQGVPQVMHPICRFQGVSDVAKGAILHDPLRAGRAMCESLDHGTRTKHGHSGSALETCKAEDRRRHPLGNEVMDGRWMETPGTGRGVSGRAATRGCRHLIMREPCNTLIESGQVGTSHGRQRNTR
jgi:hypothetical protein